MMLRELGDVEAFAQSLSVKDMIDREIESGVSFGPYHRQWLTEKAPERVQRYLTLAQRHPDLVGSDTRFSAPVQQRNANPSSFTAVASTVAETNLWTPAIWTPIPAGDISPGKVYEVRFGGIISNTSTPTVIWTPRFGQSTTPASNTAVLGASPTITTIASLANHAFHGEFTLAIRAGALAASGVTGTGNGFVKWGNANATASVAVMGGTVATTIDDTTAGGLIVSLTWGTNSGSNTCTCQWVLLRSLN